MLFKVWGERNSGTTYMRELLTVNFPNQNLEYNVDYKNNVFYYFLHGIPCPSIKFRGKTTTRYNNGTEYVVDIIMVRSLEKWLISMFNNQYEMEPIPSFDLFLTSKLHNDKVNRPVDFKTMMNRHIVDEGKTIFELRYFMYKKHIEYLMTNDNVILVSLDYVQDNDNCLKFLKDLNSTFNLNKTEFITTLPHTKSKSNEKNKEYDIDITKYKDVIDRFKDVDIENAINILEYTIKSEHRVPPDLSKIRLHIPAIPYTITRDEYSHDAFTGKVKRLSPMMRSRGFEVYHYGVETSESGANRDIELMTKDEWTNLRIKSLQYLDPKLSLEQATEKNNDPTLIPATLSNWSTPLAKEFNRRFRAKLIENYRSNISDIVCLPLSKTHLEALNLLNVTTVEIGIGYDTSSEGFRVFESYSWMSYLLGKYNKQPANYSFVIPHYFDTNEFQLCLTPTPLKVGFLGRLGISKGCGIIVEIAKKFPTVQFILCGAGDPKPFLKLPNIFYKPPIHGSERSNFLGDCIAILSLTKYLEPFGCSTVESQLCGTPVISTDWGGMAETIEQGKTGLRGHTLKDFCHGIQMAIDGKFDRQYIRERACRLYDMYKLAHNYEYVFKTVLDVFNGKNGWYSPDTHLICE
jgi:hypothetical protein